MQRELPPCCVLAYCVFYVAIGIGAAVVAVCQYLAHTDNEAQSFFQYVNASRLCLLVFIVIAATEKVCVLIFAKPCLGPSGNSKCLQVRWVVLIWLLGFLAANEYLLRETIYKYIGN